MRGVPRACLTANRQANRRGSNIFINPDVESPVHGLDLFPRNFIINVKPPSNYVGPSRVFGLSGDPDAGIPAADGLSIIEEIDEIWHLR